MTSHPLVLVPPIGLGEAFWAPLVAHLSDSISEILVWDAVALPLDQATSAESVADALIAFLDEGGYAVVDLAGLGWGGAFALFFAERHPDRVHRLGLLSTAPDTGAGFAELVTRIALISTVFADYLPHKPVLGLRDHAEIVRTEGLDAEADAILRAAFVPERREEFSAVADEVRLALGVVDPAVYAALCDAIASADVIGGLRSVRAETVVLAANDDWSVPPGTSRIAALGIPVAERIVIRNAAAFLFHPEPRHIAGLLATHFGGEG